jgi:glycosyltransferase involved in cell wall biosynthesis
VKKILFLAYHFPPAGGAGVQRSVKFVKYLPSEGILPIVISYSGKLEDRWLPEDKTFSMEIPKVVLSYGVEDTRRKANGGSGKRIRRWFCLADSFEKWWIGGALETGGKVVTDQKIKLIYASMSPFESAKAATLLAAKYKIPWVADLRDPWALDEMQVYPSFLHWRIEIKKMHTWLSTSAAIIMNTPEAANALLRAFPDFKAKRVEVITNGFDEEDFKEQMPARSDRKIRVVHSGYLHTDLGFRLRKRKNIYNVLGGFVAPVDILTRSHFFLLKAIELWVRKRPDIAEDLDVLFVGSVTESDRSLAENSKISKSIRFTGYLSHSENLRYVRTADLLFLPMHNLPAGYRSTIVPGKTYEYMASGRPILGAVPDGDAKDYLKKSGLGLISQPDDIRGITDILDSVYDAWKSNKDIVKANNEFIASFERKALTHKLADVFKDLMRD